MATQKATATKATPNAALALRGALKILTSLQRSDVRKDKVIARLEARLAKASGKPVAKKVARTPRAAKATDEDDEEAPVARKTRAAKKTTKVAKTKVAKAPVKGTKKVAAEKPAKAAKGGKVVKKAGKVAAEKPAKAKKDAGFLI